MNTIVLCIGALVLTVGLNLAGINGWAPIVIVVGVTTIANGVAGSAADKAEERAVKKVAARLAAELRNQHARGLR